MKIKREVRHLHITCIIFSSFFVSFRLIQRSKDRISRLNNKVNEPTEYEVGELEKKTWNLSYTPASMKKKGRDPCRIGWPGPECPKVPEGGMPRGERAAVLREVRKSLAGEDTCRFTFQACSLGEVGDRSLGSCAVVGLSDTLGDHGTMIDSHDTIFRIGFLPLERYKHRSGIKTNFTLCRGYQKNVKNCLLHVPIDIYGRSPTRNMYPRGDYGRIIISSTVQELRDIGVQTIPENVGAAVASKSKFSLSPCLKDFAQVPDLLSFIIYFPRIFVTRYLFTVFLETETIHIFSRI